MNSKCKAIFNIIILKFLIIHVVKDFVGNHNKNYKLELLEKNKKCENSSVKIKIKK
jgi:hypothetical protein